MVQVLERRKLLPQYPFSSLSLLFLLHVDSIHEFVDVNVACPRPAPATMLMYTLAFIRQQKLAKGWTSPLSQFLLEPLPIAALIVLNSEVTWPYNGNILCQDGFVTKLVLCHC
jgi:hypothetical protein